MKSAFASKFGCGPRGLMTTLVSAPGFGGSSGASSGGLLPAAEERDDVVHLLGGELGPNAGIGVPARPCSMVVARKPSVADARNSGLESAPYFPSRPFAP